jgi:hypothetical protein
MRYLAAIVVSVCALYAAPAMASFEPMDYLANAKLSMGTTHQGPSATLLDKKLSNKVETGKHLIGTLDNSESLQMFGDGDGGGASPVVAFVIGFFVGFGIGHWYAGDTGWLSWLWIDLAFLVGYIVFSIVLAIFLSFAWILGYILELAWLVWRIWEGYSAYSFASGHGNPAVPKMSMREQNENDTGRKIADSMPVFSFSF